MTAGLPKRFFVHLRFTVAEFRAQRSKLGLPTASRFLGMRTFSPFGIGKSWQKGTASEDTEVTQLRAAGFCELPPRSAAEVQSLVGMFLSSMAERTHQPFETLSSYFQYARERKMQRPEGVLTSGQDLLSQMLRNPRLVALAAEYLRLPPSRMVGNANMDALVRVDGGAINTGYDNALRFHRDVDSYRFVKMFVYLTDCRQGDGHHEIYLNSHLYRPIRLGPIGRYEAAEIERSIPQARLRRVEGPAGYMFAEDTFAFHRGTVPVGHDRLICNLEYMDETFAAIHSPSCRLV